MPPVKNKRVLNVLFSLIAFNNNTNPAIIVIKFIACIG